jgi:hypothetical protein
LEKRRRWRRILRDCTARPTAAVADRSIGDMLSLLSASLARASFLLPDRGLLGTRRVYVIL